MKSAFKKIIESLEEDRRERELVAMHTSDVFVDGQVSGLDKAIEIVKEVAEEYGNDGWISCSERLPNKNGVYNVTKEMPFGDNISDCAYFDGQDTWHNDNRVSHGRGYLTNVIAWQPLPKQYVPDKNVTDSSDGHALKSQDV